jgi:hypothetical protein
MEPQLALAHLIERKPKESIYRSWKKAKSEVGYYCHPRWLGSRIYTFAFVVIIDLLQNEQTIATTFYRRRMLAHNDHATRSQACIDFLIRST